MIFLWLMSAFLINVSTGYFGYHLEQKAQSKASATKRVLYWLFPWWSLIPFIGFGIVGVATYYGHISIQNPLTPFIAIASLFGFIAGTVLSEKTFKES